MARHRRSRSRHHRRRSTRRHVRRARDSRGRFRSGGRRGRRSSARRGSRRLSYEKRAANRAYRMAKSRSRRGRGRRRMTEARYAQLLRALMKARAAKKAKRTPVYSRMDVGGDDYESFALNPRVSFRTCRGKRVSFKARRKRRRGRGRLPRHLRPFLFRKGHRPHNRCGKRRRSSRRRGRDRRSRR